MDAQINKLVIVLEQLRADGDIPTADNPQPLTGYLWARYNGDKFVVSYHDVTHDGGLDFGLSLQNRQCWFNAPTTISLDEAVQLCLTELTLYQADPARLLGERNHALGVSNVIWTSVFVPRPRRQMPPPEGTASKISINVLPNIAQPTPAGNACSYCTETLTVGDIAAEVQVIRAEGSCFSYYHAHCLAEYEAGIHVAVQPLRDTLFVVAPLDLNQLPAADIPTDVWAASLRLLQLKGNNVEAAQMRELLGYGWAAHDAGYHLAELLTAKHWIADEVKVLVEGWGLHERLSR